MRNLLWVLLFFKLIFLVGSNKDPHIKTISQDAKNEMVYDTVKSSINDTEDKSVQKMSDNYLGLFFHIDFSDTKNALMCLLIVLIITLLKPTLKWRFIKNVPEANVQMFYGVALASLASLFQSEWTFNSKFFFLVLLPSIVNDAGLSMNKMEFFRNFGRISLYAIWGTLLSTILTTLALHYLLSSFFQFKTSFLVLFMFSSIISAVDPVSVLSTLSEVQVKSSLSMLIFGESLFNDAVTIVLYRMSSSMVELTDNQSALNYFHVGMIFIGVFLYVGICGILIGVIGGFFAVFILKKLAGNQMLLPLVQLAFPFLFYLVAESLHLSGILALIVSSMILSYYRPANVCVEMELVDHTVSKTMASLSESIIFFYLGVSVVSEVHLVDVNFIISVFLTTFFVRLIVIFSLSFITNFCVDDSSKLLLKEQYFMVHSGIRGAVCFGLVQTINEDIVPVKNYLVTCTLAIIALTSVLQGCTVKYLLKRLKIDKQDSDSGSTSASTSKFVKILKNIDENFLTSFLRAETTYDLNDETFKHLNLPKNVSVALGIDKRSQANLERSSSSKSLNVNGTVSIAKSTTSPHGVDFNLKENEVISLAPVSTGRRTPVQRGSVYSRHFLPILDNEEIISNNYLSLQQSRNDRRRILFNQYDTFHGDSAVDVELEFGQKRHNSMGAKSVSRKDKNADSVELENMLPAKKKTSRTVVSGKKTFVVDKDDRNSINNESNSTKSDSDDNVPKKFDVGDSD